MIALGVIDENLAMEVVYDEVSGFYYHGTGLDWEGLGLFWLFLELKLVFLDCQATVVVRLDT